jgi:deoxyribonuclease-4
MSIGGGLPRAVERATAVCAAALQVFVKSSNQWAARPFLDGEAEAFRRAARAAGVADHTVAHASYLINLASPDPLLWRRSVEALREEVSRCRSLEIPYLVLHPGSHVGSGEQAGLDRVARALDRVVSPGRAIGTLRRSASRGRVRLLLEITAGQGDTLGWRFEQIAGVLRRARCSRQLGVCFDTCHAFAAGYEFRDRRSYRETFRDLDARVGLDRVLVFHLNDSKGALGSRLDRHAHIGRGEIGLEAFRLILNDPRFAERPMILETPKGEDLAEDRENLAVLRAMIAT